MNTEEKGTTALYVHNGLADWEASFILPELAKASFKIVTIAEDSGPVKTMGGLTLLPDLLLAQVNWSDVCLLILPGGDSWMNPQLHQPVLELLPDLKNKGVGIAAICGATVALARIGLLNDVRHTSNYLPLLKALAPEYRGEGSYSNDLAVTDGKIITASGIGSLEFTFEILKLLKVYEGDRARDWYEFFKHAVVPKWLME